MKIFLISLFFAFSLAGCRASRQLDRSNQQDLKLAESYYLSGALLDFQEKHKAALFEYRKAFVYDSSSAQITKAIGRNFYRLGKYRSAIRFLKYAHQNAPEDKDALYYLAEAYYKEKNYKAAITYFEKLDDLTVLNINVQANLLFLYRKMGKINSLIALREKRVNLLGIESESAQELLTLYLQNNQIIKAEALTNTMIVEAPEKPQSWLAYGIVMEESENLVKATEAYHKVINLTPMHQEAVERLYALFKITRNWHGLVDLFDEILNAHPENLKVREYLAEGHFQLNNFNKSQSIITPLLKNVLTQKNAQRLLKRINEATSKPMNIQK